MRWFRSLRQLGIEVVYLTLAVAVGFAVLGYLTRTGAFSSIEASALGAPARWFRALLYQTYNP